MAVSLKTAPSPDSPEPFFPISPLVCHDRVGLCALRGTFLRAFNDKTDKLSITPSQLSPRNPSRRLSDPLPRVAVARSEDCRLVADSQGRMAGSALPAGT